MSFLVVKQYKAVRITGEVRTLRERAAVLRYAFDNV